MISKYSGVKDIESIVASAINDTLLQAIKNIDQYDPDKAEFMKWINGILRNEFSDARDRYRKYQERYQPTSLDRPISADNPNSIAETQVNNTMEQEAQARTQDREQDEMASIVRQFIQKDPEGHFARTHIQNRPDVTFQKILLMRLEPKTWQAIADSFNISSHATINTFHDRNLRKYNSYFRTYLSKQWYR